MISIALLWPLYIIGIQYERGGLWRIVLPVTVVALALDIFLNYTELALLTLDWPKSHEYTFSQRLQRLVGNTDWRGSFARFVKVYMLDWADPDGVHIR